MVNSNKKVLIQKHAGLIRSAAFFILFFLYLWLKVDLRLIYHSGGVVINFPVFYRDWMFFCEHLSYPGGILEYIAAFLAQFWYIGWAGAFIATLTAWLIFVCTDTIIKLVNATQLRFVRFIGPILLLAIYTRYTYHFGTTVSLLVGLAFVSLYLKITQKHKRFNIIVFLVLSAILYYLGGKSYSLFAVLCLIYEWLFNGRAKTGLLYLLLGIAVPYAAEGLIGGLCAHDIFIRHLPLPFSLRTPMLIIAYMLYFLVPLTILGLGLCRIIRPQKIRINKKARINTHRPAAVTLSEVIKTIILLVTAGLSVFLAYDPQKIVLKADYYTCHRMWPEVIRTARRFPDSYFMLHMVDRALYHTGRLGCDILTFPQNAHVLFLTSEKLRERESAEAVSAHWKRFGTYLDLGCMNHAQHGLLDSLEMFGERPVLLKNLALINMVKGNYNSAKVYLGTLSKTLFHADWANEYIKKLESDPTLQRDKEVQRLRSVMLTKNYDFSAGKIDRVLLDLLETNSQNQMAFEYLMTCYLLAGQLDDFILNLYRLKNFDYPRIPRLYEEAILLYKYKTQKSINLHGFQISRKSVQRYANFAQTVDFYRGNLRAAYNVLAKNYGDSYMFYYVYKHSGGKNE